MQKTQFKDFLTKVFKTTIDYLFPIFCIKCGKYGEFLCGDCLQNYEYYTKQKCFVCDKLSKDGITHKECINKNSPNQLFVIANYGPLERQIIHKLKYKNAKDYAEVIARIMIPKVKKLQLNNYVFCPIPLHNKKLRIRGYNQVELIINFLIDTLGKGRIERLLIRNKITKPQNELNRKERFENLEDAFIINKELETRLPEKVVIVDDLTTSGATFKEAIKVLKGHGVKEIICLAFARGQ